MLLCTLSRLGNICLGLAFAKAWHAISISCHALAVSAPEIVWI